MKPIKSNCDFDDFPIGQRVLVIAKMQDFRFFFNQIGTVEKIREGYLGISIVFDEPMNYADGTVLEGFSFNPKDLIPLSESSLLLSSKVALKRGFVPCEVCQVMVHEELITYHSGLGLVCGSCLERGCCGGLSNV